MAQVHYRHEGHGDPRQQLGEVAIAREDVQTRLGMIRPFQRNR